MLLVMHRLHQLEFGKLMQVYEESNRENGAECFPDLEPHRQLLQAEQDFYAYLRSGFFTAPEDRYCIWQEQGQYLAALRLQRYQDGLLLEALETHPEHRNRGYAKRLIRSVQETVGQGKIYVHISRRNGPSIAVHTACGFRKILDYGVYADGSVNRHTDTYLWEKTV